MHDSIVLYINIYIIYILYQAYNIYTLAIVARQKVPLDTYIFVGAYLHYAPICLYAPKTTLTLPNPLNSQA